MSAADRLAEQSGVISRRQAQEEGLTKVDIERLIRRREWTVVHPRVYVDHTGPLTWHQRAWAAVLALWPAALCHQSALRAADGHGRRDAEEKTVHVAIDRDRHLDEPEGVRLHRMAGFEDRVLWSLAPPRIRYEEALLDLAADAPTDLAALGRLADACGSRRTTAARLLDHLGRRQRIPRRDWLSSVLQDIAEGTCSVLEHGYLVHVERAHDLPVGRRQPAALTLLGPALRDVLYEEHGLVVELDGRAYHESAEARDRDLDRDLDAAVDALESVRLGYGQVFARPCATAERIARILQRRGWKGTARPCAACGEDRQAS